MAGQDFSTVDHLDTRAFNLALWQGLGAPAPYPARTGADLSGGRADLLAKAVRNRCRAD
jgi:hypothetical protein